MSTQFSEQVQKMRDAIAGFLHQLDRNPIDGDAGVRSLALALDRLVAVYFELDEIEPEGGPEPPPKSSGDFHRRASNAFPELGLYPYADPGGEPGKEVSLVADAIDDIGDIASDLAEVLWYLDNGSVADGLWDFRFGYQHHWGDHLHSLRNYLHSSRIAAW